MIVESVQEEKEITFLTDPNTQYVSLVSRGANQIPWKIVKIEGEAMTTQKVLQAIIAPEDMKEEDLKKALGQDQIFKLDNPITGGGHVKYNQLPKENFKSDSFELVTLDFDNNIKGIAGNLKKGSVLPIAKIEKENDEILLVEQTEAKAPLFTRPTPGIVVDLEADSPEVSAKYMETGVADEMERLFNLMHSALTQEKADTDWRLSTIKTSVENFIGYLSDALVLAKGAINLPMAEAQNIQVNVNVSDEAPEVEKKEEGKPEAENKEPVEKQEEAKPVDSEKDNQLTEMAAIIKSLSGTIEELKAQVIAIPEIRKSDNQKPERELTKEEKRQKVYAGMLKL